MGRLAEICSESKALEKESKKIFREEWAPRFAKATTDKEFGVIRSELCEACGDSGLQCSLHVMMCFEIDSFQERVRKAN